jgi:hypothetical protein
MVQASMELNLKQFFCNLDKKNQIYLDAESHLTISDFKEVEKNIKVLSAKNTQLEEKFKDLLQYLRTNSIEVPNF